MGDSGDLLRDARERMRLTQEELAQQVGVSRATVGAWEKGTPPRSSLGRIRQVLGLDEDLRPVGSSERSNLGAMSNGELVARMNNLVSQLNALSVEVARRLQDTDFDTVDPEVAEKAGYSPRLVDGRFVADYQDIDFGPEEDPGQTKGRSATGR